MVQDRELPNIKQKASTDNDLNQAAKATAVIARSSRLTRLGHLLTATWTLVAAIAYGNNLSLVQMLEFQARSLFFEIRGPVAPPENIVILAIDEPSLSIPEQYYQTDSQRYAYLEPLQAWPWKRAAYAQAIERLMAAGASSVAVDVLFTTPSSYGAADDAKLAKVLQRYADRVTVAAEYQEVEMRQGSLIQLTQPARVFETQPLSIGSINFPLEADDKVHRFAREFPKLLAEKYQEQVDDFDALKVAIPSFEEAVVAVAQPNISDPKGEFIYFYGPPSTFEKIPFWHVLDPENWNTYLQKGKYFKDKIVLIGATAPSLQDFHGTPFAKSWLYPEPMSGVEIHANAIATLLEGRAIALAISDNTTRGIFVLVFVAGAVILLSRPKQAFMKCLWAMGIATTWISISYFSFVYAQLILPTAIPVIAIALSGCSYLATAAASDSIRKLHLRRTLARYASFPVVQEIISQQDDLQDLLQERELVALGKIVGGRYKIVKVLGAGGFSETYIAEDKQRPGNPLCVVKQLRPAHNHPKHLQLARRLFRTEAETLEKLGTHHQIPQLYAYFEQDEEFYLVQELIVGHPLSYELVSGRPIMEAGVIHILLDILRILEFVHSYNVIHRDIKPSNIIRRLADGKLVLIDFGAVKQLSTQLLEHEKQSSYTIGIGTQGYAPSEQYAGRVQYSSDIYAVGMIGIKALTGLAPHELQLDSKTGEFFWTHKAQVSPSLAEIISKMVRYDFTKRYQSALEARLALEELVNATSPLVTGDCSRNIPTENIDTPTVPWVAATTEIIEPSSQSSVPPQK